MIGTILLAIGLILLAGVLLYACLRVRRFLITAFGTADIAALIKQRQKEEEDTPRSVAGATDLILPRLAADFPEINWAQFRSMAETAVLERLAAQGATNPLIHRTALCDYRKAPGVCYAVTRSAVQFYRDEKKTQSRFAVTLAYIQDPDKFGHELGFGFTCPRCGAPITSLGDKKCAYCGGAVEPIVPRVWHVERVEEES